MLTRELDELIDLVGGEGYVCRALNIHRTTLMRWRTGRVLPSQASMDLLRALAGKSMPWAGRDWDGWHFNREHLCGPEGEAFTAMDLKGWWIERQMIPTLQAEVYRLRDMVRELAAQVKPLDPAANDMAAWEGDPRAWLHAEPPLAVAPRNAPSGPPERESSSGKVWAQRRARKRAGAI